MPLSTDPTISLMLSLTENIVNQPQSVDAKKKQTKQIKKHDNNNSAQEDNRCACQPGATFKNTADGQKLTVVECELFQNTISKKNK